MLGVLSLLMLFVIVCLKNVCMWLLVKLMMYMCDMLNMLVLVCMVVCFLICEL